MRKQRSPADDQNQAIHAEVLSAARRLGRAEDWTFRLGDVVRALPHLNERSVRTHVASRCCVNAPQNHAHRWPYFRRVGRGRYRVELAFREPAPRRPQTDGDLSVADRVAEPGLVDGAGAQAGPDAGLDAGPEAGPERSTIHAVMTRSEGWFVAECLEVAVVTQGRTLDETLANLREALELHLDPDELARLGLTSAPRLVVSFETTAFAA